MIWLLWHLFIALDITIHRFVIVVFKYDPTPDGQRWWQAIPEVGFRVAAAVALFYFFGDKNFIALDFFIAGSIATHLLLFGPFLNKTTGKAWHHLGNGPVDTVLALLPFGPRQFFLLILSIASIYTYYNYDLLQP